MVRKTELKLVRENDAIPRSYWRPAWGLVRKTKLLSINEVKELASYGHSNRIPVSVEDPYKAGRFINRFLLDPLGLVIIHESVKSFPISSRIISEVDASNSKAVLPIIWNSVRIGEDVQIDPCVEIMPYATVLDRARLVGRSLIGSNARIGNQAHIIDSVIGPETQIGNGSSVCNGGMTEKRVVIGDNVWLKKDNLAAYYAHINHRAMMEEGAAVACFGVVEEDQIVSRGECVGDMTSRLPTGYVKRAAQLYSQWGYDQYSQSLLAMLNHL